MTEKAPRFQLGDIVATPGAMALLTPEDMGTALQRHMSGDWGDPADIDEEDRHANDMALLQGTRLLSVYRKGDVNFWIITEADRSVTTFLLPEEY